MTPPEPYGRAAPLPPDERRAAIVRAVLPVFEQHGRAATSRQLAAAAGVSEGTIFNVFGDKDSLVRAVLEAVVDPEPFEREIAAIPADLAFEQRLIEAVRAGQTRIARVWSFISLLGPPAHHGDDDRHHRPRPFESPGLTAVFEGDPDRLRLDPADAARTLLAIVFATSHPMLASSPLAPERIVDLFLHGVEAGR